jgi:signal transduction histidine kinase
MNRYERLFGHMYSRVVEDLSKIESPAPDDIVVASVLLFKSFNETLYYIGTHENPLVMPDEVKPSDCNRLKGIKHLSPRSLWYLAQYFCSKWGKTQIEEVFAQNKELVDGNVSTFSLTYPDYDRLKQAWLDWTLANSSNSWDPPPDEELENHPIIYQAFILANMLLIIMPISLSRESHEVGDGTLGSINNASDIYNLIMGGRPELSLWTDDEGKYSLLPKEEVISWRYMKRGGNTFSYSELLDVTEFILIQPISGRRKEVILERLIKERVFDPPTFSLSAIALPLFYNCEFQGIIFLVKEYNQGGFRPEDAKRLVNKVKSLQLESRFAESRYDLAQIALLQPNAKDTNHPSLIRVLNIMPLFTSASAGIVVYEDNNNGLTAMERYRMSKGQGVRMETNPRRGDVAKILECIEKIISREGQGPVWLFKKEAALMTLLELAPNGERAHANSAMIIPLSDEQGKSSYFVLFFRESVEFIYSFCFQNGQGVPGPNDDDWKTFAERVANAIERLLDTDREYKRTLAIKQERNRLRASDLSLMTPHTVKNSFEPRVIRPLTQALQRIQDDDARRMVEFAMKYAKRLTEQANKVSLAWKHVLNLRDGRYTGYSESHLDTVRVTPDDFSMLCERMRRINFPYERERIFYKTDATEGAYIAISQDILEYIIDQLLSNAIEASKDLPDDAKRFELCWREDTALHSGSPITVEISVWNANTHIAELYQQAAGTGPMKNVEPHHSGLGFYFMESALSQLDALVYETNKHFKIENTEESSKGVRISFAFPATVERTKYE